MIRGLRAVVASIFCLAAMAAFSSLYAQQIIWERTFAEQERIPAATGAGVVGERVVVDSLGRIHVVGPSGPGTVRIAYVQLQENGDTLQHLLFADSLRRYSLSATLYTSALVREQNGQTALMMLRRKPGLYLAVLPLTASGFPTDTLVDTSASANTGIARLVEPDGGFAIASFNDEVWDVPNNHLTLNRYDSLGHFLWRQSYPASVDSPSVTADIQAWDMVKAPHNGYYIWCNFLGTESYYADDGMLLRTDSLGNEIWRVRLRDTSNNMVLYSAEAIGNTRDGGAIVALNTAGSFVPGQRGDYAEIMRLDSSGEVVWRRSLSHLRPRLTRITACDSTRDGGFLFVGRTDSVNGANQVVDTFSQFYLLKTDAEGKTQWEWQYGSDTTTDWLQDFVYRSDTIVVCGASGTQTSISGSPRNDIRMYVAKLLPPPVAAVERERTPVSGLIVTPNPGREQATVEFVIGQAGTVRVELISMRGIMIGATESRMQTGGQVLERINLQSLPAGQYQIRVLLDAVPVASGLLVHE